MSEAESCLVSRLRKICDLTDDEIELLGALEGDSLVFRPGDLVRGPNAGAGDLYVVSKGWVYSAIDLENGSRQIINIYLPGDIVGLMDLAYDQSMLSIVSMTHSVINEVSRSRLRDILKKSRRLSTILFMVDMRQQVRAIDRLIAISQFEAFERICHLLSELCRRVKDQDHEGGNDLVIPLTQQQIGEMLGLTSIHVNRTFKRLQDENLVLVARGRISIPDMSRLNTITDVRTAFGDIKLEWLNDIGAET